MLSKHVKFEHANISRKLIKNAEYNPRKISIQSQKRLKKILQTSGLCQSLVWNKRTGNLVGGHQRITILDQLEKSNDYEIPCDIVDIDLRDEIKLNVQLNQVSAMGEFDADMLNNIHMEFPDINFMDDFGFDRADLDFMFNDVEKIIGEDQIAESKKNIITAEEFRERKKQYRENAPDEYVADGWENMLTIVFNAPKEKELFLQKMKIKPKEKYIKAGKIFDAVKDEFKW